MSTRATSIWYRLLGTAHYPEDHSWPERYGVPDPHPKSWAAQMLHLFLSRDWQKKLAANEARLMKKKPSQLSVEAIK